MSRKLLIPLFMLVLTSMACSLFNPTAPNQPGPTATQPPAVLEEKPTATIAEPTTAPELPTAAPQPTDTVVIVPTENPTNTPEVLPTETEVGPIEIIDEFDHNTGDWSDDLVVTTQTFGRDLTSGSVIQDGALRFSFNDKETYIYKFFNTPIDGDVTIQAEYQSIGHLNNGIAIVCKVNQEKTSWFEVRVSSTSDFSFYLYDKKRKTDLGKNPYLQLGKGKFKIDELAPTKPNIFQLSCRDNELVLNANLDKRIVTQSLDTPLDGTGVGIGAMSYDVIPIKINFERISILQEK